MSNKKESPLDYRDAKRIGRIVHKDGSISIFEGKGFLSSCAILTKINLEPKTQPQTRRDHKFKNEPKNETNSST